MPTEANDEQAQGGVSPENNTANMLTGLTGAVRVRGELLNLGAHIVPSGGARYTPPEGVGLRGKPTDKYRRAFVARGKYGSGRV